MHCLVAIKSRKVFKFVYIHQKWNVQFKMYILFPYQFITTLIHIWNITGWELTRCKWVVIHNTFKIKIYDSCVVFWVTNNSHIRVSMKSKYCLCVKLELLKVSTRVSLTREESEWRQEMWGQILKKPAKNGWFLWKFMFLSGREKNTDGYCILDVTCLGLLYYKNILNALSWV